MKISNKIKNKVKNRINIYLKQLIDDNATNILALKVNSKLEKFRNIHLGKDIYIIGCGPTEQYFELPKKDNSIFIGINRAFMDKRIKFDYLFTQDACSKGWQDFVSYRPKSCIKMLAWITNNDNLLIKNSDANKIPNAYRYVLDCCHMGKFPYDISYQPFADLRGTVFSAIQFALYTNPKRIFIVGFDCSVGDIFLKNNEDFRYQLESWKRIKEYVNKFWNDVEFVSINPVNLRSLFKDIYTESYLESFKNDL